MLPEKYKELIREIDFYLESDGVLSQIAFKYLQERFNQGSWYLEILIDYSCANYRLLSNKEIGDMYVSEGILICLGEPSDYQSLEAPEATKQVVEFLKTTLSSERHDLACFYPNFSLSDISESE